MRVLVLAAAVCTAALPAIGQIPVTNDLTPNLEPQRYRICNDRPARPAWADELHIREAWKGLTLRHLYELRAWENLVSSQDCSCGTRFPDWALADEEYRARYFPLSQGEQTALRSEFMAAQRLLEDQVRVICEAQGNW